MRTRLLLILLWVVALSGCARQIPNRVTSDEYAIYSAWVTARFARAPPEHLFFSSRTGNFDTRSECNDAITRAGVSHSLLGQLHALGEAEFPLNFYSTSNLQIPWSYKEVELAPDLPPGSFHLISFSRVAFDRDHNEALFGVFDSCAGGECGKGGYIQGIKRNGKWSFRSVGCVIIA